MSFHGEEAFDVADDRNMCLDMLLRNGSWGRMTVCRINNCSWRHSDLTARDTKVSN
jgi:hypothetical protein